MRVKELNLRREDIVRASLFENLLRCGIRFVRSAPVPGRSNVTLREALEKIASHCLLNIAVAEDGHTPKAGFSVRL